MHAEIVSPEKRQAFVNISLKRHSCTWDFWSLGGFGQPIEAQSKVIYCDFSCNCWKHRAYRWQLAIFIHEVDNTLTITAEFMELVPISDTTTAADKFTALVGVLGRVGVTRSHSVSLSTDGAPPMIGIKASIVTKFSQKVQTKNRGYYFGTFLCIFPPPISSHCNVIKDG